MPLVDVVVPVVVVVALPAEELDVDTGTAVVPEMEAMVESCAAMVKVSLALAPLHR